MSDNPNITAADRYRKFPVNWLPDEFNLMQKIADTEYQGVLAQYIRRTIKKDLRARGLIQPNGQIELFDEIKPMEQMERHQQGVKRVFKPEGFYVDPPRRYSGFLAGLNRNKGVARWFQERKKQYIQAQANVRS